MDLNRMQQLAGVALTRPGLTENPSDEKEFERRRGLPGVDVQRMKAGRTFDVVLKLNGKEIGTKSEISKRGKVAQTVYHLPPMREAVDLPLSESDVVGKTILQQMGGPGRLAAMLGTRHFGWLPNGVQFKWPNKQRSRGNVVRITLRNDEYDMEFFNGEKSVKKYEGLQASQLVDVFEKQTGWYLSIGGSKKPSGSGRTPGPEMPPMGTKHESKLDELRALLDGRDLAEAHDFKVGDMLYSSWGYDQTNIDFYQVTAITAAGLTIREVEKHVVGGQGTHTELVAPLPNQFAGEPMKKRAAPNGSVKINSYERAHKWDGKPKGRTGSGYGH